ncbi:MAG: M15 family metallopeptidase, partial [Bacteroidota bacterium]
GLKVYDCYRPQQAVSHFVRWANGSDAAMKTAFYPDENRGRLFQRGYIARRSGHSRGSTVDLTLVDLPASGAIITSYPQRDELKRCDRPRGERIDEADLDMGTAYDCLDTASATASGAVSAEAQRNRQILKSAMARRGFRNYSKEWWHFTLNGEPFRNTYHDFPVE